LFTATAQAPADAEALGAALDAAPTLAWSGMVVPCADRVRAWDRAGDVRAGLRIEIHPAGSGVARAMLTADKQHSQVLVIAALREVSRTARL